MYSKKYKHYVTILLLIVYIFNQTDRAIFGFLMQPIKEDLGFTDTELGFLAGPALVIFYALLGIPIARLADRSSRVNIISTAIALWSGIVTLSATVSSFWHFTLARIGVGIGEAGFSAVAQSLITDYHTEKERTRALSTFMLALPLGGVLSALMGGWINEVYGWRAVFIAAGVPGLFLAFLMKLTVKEPERRRHEPAGEQRAEEKISIRDVFRVLWRRRTLRHLALAMGLVNTVCAAMLTWIPAFFIRNHGISTGELGAWMAAIGVTGGSAGIWLGGYVTTRFGMQDERNKVRSIATATALIAPIVAVTLWYPSKEVALLALIPGQTAMFFFYGPTFSLVQGLCAPGMRATMASLFILIQVLAGGVIGVQLLGIISDSLATSLDSGMALRWSMTLVSLLAIWAAYHFWAAGRTLRQDLTDGDHARVG